MGHGVVCVAGRQAAYLLIAKDAHRISLFIFTAADDPNLGTPPPAVSTLAWRNRDLALVAVGGVPPADLAALRDAFTR
jgi:hypothetical protein